MKGTPKLHRPFLRMLRSGKGAARAAGFGLPVLLAAGLIARAGVIQGLLSPTTAASIGAGATPASARAVTVTSPGAASAQATLARAANAVAAVRAMQASARMLAASQNNLGADPNHPGQALPDVPDGLATPDPASTGPGLRIDVDAQGRPVLWTGANLPATDGANPNQINIVQNQQQALLQWRTFDIGRHTALTFDQRAGGDSAGQWIAFNKINDPSGRPSQILGAINTIGPAGTPGSGGQVYVINQNGIIFGGSSQVNTHALVAASLPINDNLVSAGLLNNPDSQFLFTAVPQSAGNVTSAFTPPPPPAGQIGDVIVLPGAVLKSPATVDNGGGLIALIGPNVSNAGTIETDNGQTILAAGLQVGFVPHAQSDPSLRGLDVFVGSVDPGTLPFGVTLASGTVGAAANNVTADGTMGVIEAPRGDVMIAGRTVNQLGIIDSSTSVAYNGRVDLLADYNSVVVTPQNNSNSSSQFSAYFNPKTAGTVKLGAGSVTQILPDSSTTDRVVGTQLALASLVNVQGNSIYLSDVNPVTGAADSSKGAMIIAPGASLPPSNATADQPQTNQAVALTTANNLNLSSLSAGVTLSAGNWILNTGNPAIQYQFFNATDPVASPNLGRGQIYFDPGATVDVAGSQGGDAGATASVSEDIVPVQLRGTELANSPLQRNGPLRGQTVQVDIRQTGKYNGQTWIGTPLGDASGYVNLMQRTAGELTTNGGTVSLNAGDSVVMQPGSTV
ncbi:MAG TPA: filamentous hemagglutinin N-terminal domain-containing protein, partial [Opitutaceae bacterium]|nr:filamentous hemagglutinin N-terminal domain-containing protein [Opitutaceae bacterium]